MADDKWTLSISENDAIRQSVQKIALHTYVDEETKTLKGTRKVTGHVVKINEEDGVAKSVDVQEYVPKEEAAKGIGLHKEVLLTAIKNSGNSMLLVPKLHSDVVIIRDAKTLTEYIGMVSSVDVIQLDSFEKAFIGVQEREEYNVHDSNQPCIECLDKTGVKAVTSYTKNTVKTEVVAESGKADKTTVQTITGGAIEQKVGDKTNVVSDGKGHHVTYDKSTVEVGGKEVTLTQGKSSVKVTDGTVYVGSESNTDDAVLGSALCDVLMDLCTQLVNTKVTTQLGPQPLLTMAQFMQLKAKIQAAKNGHNNFLTKKVQIQK